MPRQAPREKICSEALGTRSKPSGQLQGSSGCRASHGSTNSLGKGRRLAKTHAEIKVWALLVPAAKLRGRTNLLQMLTFSAIRLGCHTYDPPNFQLVCAQRAPQETSRTPAVLKQTSSRKGY